MVSLSLNQAPTAVPMHRGTPWSSQHAQANHSISTTSTTCAVEDEWLSIVSRLWHCYSEAHIITQTEGQPAQLPRHTIPVPITRAQIPLHTDYFDIPLVNAVPPHFEGSAQDHASDNTAYPSVTLSSLNPSDMLSHAVGRPQGNGNVSRSGGPPFIQDATTGSTASRASRAIHCEYIAPGMSSWSAFPNPGTVPNRGPCPSGYLDHENFRAPLEWTESSDRFTGQRYPPSNALTEIASSPDMLYDPPLSLPTPSQPNLNPQAVTLHASASVSQSPNPPLPSPREIYSRDCCSSTGNGNPPTPTSPPRADYLHIRFVDPRGANRAFGCSKVRRQTTVRGSSAVNKSISTRYAGRFAKPQSRTRVRPSAGPLCDQNVRACCGWQDEDGNPCGVLVTHHNCAAHFAEAHDIRDMAANVEVPCRWCPLSAEKKVVRHNVLRHLREVHLGYRRSTRQYS
ncbi:hypothetical protein EDD17DRAFT_1612452 [Pisolithus thermaeus]|nr:hypothetical protein EDD17DRAFT_1612452 [Pisolithus thermaeus]